MDVRLVIPDLGDERAALAFRDEIFAHGEYAIHGDGGLDGMVRYADWVRVVHADMHAETVRPGLVPATTFFAKRPTDGHIVGVIQVRHVLSDPLLRLGGHIGYHVRPSERRKGYATAMLRRALEYARSIGIERALITCRADNIASARTIETCGGAPENTVCGPDGVRYLRYWAEC